MARSFSTEDVKSLILQYKQLQVDLHGILESTQRESKSAVEKAAKKVIDSKVLSGSISDDLRRGQSKAPKTFDTQALMSALYRCIHSAPIVDLCLALFNEHGSKVQTSLQVLQQIASPFRRFFAGSKAKASAEAAYDYLSSLASGIWGNTIRQSVEAIRQINSVSPTSAFMDYENNPDTYYQALIECAPNTVRTDRPLSQMIPIISRHEALLGQYSDASSRLSQKLTDDQNAVRQSAEKSLAAGVIEQLRGFEVESLSQRRSGIRVKALRDAGYNTIEDVYCATVSNLASVYGISEDAAKVIKSEARKMAEEVQKTVRLKISSDQKTQEITALLTALYAYMRDKTAIDFFESIESSSKTVITGINAFRRLSNNLSWLFLSDSGRAEYCVVYQRLSSLIDSDYPKAIAAIQTRSNSQDRYNASEVWGHFSNHSIDYFNALEQLVPGILGNGDTLYGLPEDLAREIQDQTFFPQGLKVTLRRYQEWGVKYILHQERVLLGDEMGLGKTVQALGTMVSLRNTGATHFLVVCPASVLPNWCKEIDRKSEFRSTKVHGPNRQNAIDEWIKAGGVAVTTYETTSLIDIPKNYRFDLLVVDEAHYIKNIDARRSKSVRELSEKAKRILFMTGTALENRVDEMISLIDVLRPNLANRIRSIAFMSSAPQFREQVAPVYYRRKRDDVLTELPDVINNEEMCELLPEEEALYENAVLSKHQTGIRRVSWMIEDLNKSSKARRMREIIADAEDDGRKVLVFSFYRDTLKAISSFLGSRCTQIINGSVPVERRQQIIDEFEDMPAGSVLLAQIGAGGTGLNIQAASVVIICEPQLKPSTENQAIARAHRMGQSRTVLVYRLLAADTIDERIDDMLKEKQAIFDAFADKSAAADATNREESQIDDKTLGKLILEEINRINAKNGNPGPAQTPGVVIPIEEDVSDNTTVTVEVKPRQSESPRNEERPTAPDAHAKAEPTHIGNREAVLTKTDSAKEERVQSPKSADPPVIAFPSIELLVQYPDSVELREALFNILARQSTVSGKFKDAALLREMASLAEDIIEMGGGAEGRDHYQAMLAFFNQELHNPERAKAIVDNATEMMFSKEVLLPTALVGRKRVEAQKKLIYMCADLIRRTVFDMYDQQEVDDVERLALLPAEKIMECLYGESFARHFEHVTTMYIGVKAAIARGDQKDAILRLKDLVQRLEQKEEESAVITPLVPEYEVELYYTSSLALLNVRNQAKVLLGNVETDFQKNDVNEDTVNDIKHRLERLSQSSGGQLKEDCITFIVNMMKQQREGTYTGELLEEMKK